MRSTVTISTRIDPAMRAAVVALARKNGTSLGVIVRTALACLAHGAPGSALFALSGNVPGPDDLAELIKFLGLPPNASSDDVTQAVAAILGTPDGVNDPAGATGGGADASKDPARQPKGAAYARQLTKAELAYVQKHKITREEFEARKRAAVRTATRKGS